MTDAIPNPRRRRPYLQAAVGVVVLAAFIAAASYLTSDRFYASVRAKIVAEIADATGGRVELRELHWKLSTLRLEALDLTIHGLEGPNEIPYAHADRIVLQAKVGSLFNRHFGLRYLELDRPVVHFIVYPDGSTNQPTPKTRGTNNSPVQDLFRLAVNKTVVRDGQLIVNDHPIPLDFNADDVEATMTYASTSKRYDSTVHVGKIDTKFKDLRPFSAAANAEFSVMPNAVQLKSLAISTGDSRLEASGNLQDFSKPNITLKYGGTLHLAQAGAILRTPNLRGGILNIEGQGAYNPSGYVSSGKLNIRGMNWQERSLRLHDASLGADFTLNKDRIVFPHVFAALLGGTASGEAEVANWTGPASGASGSSRVTHTAKASQSQEQRGSIRLRVLGMSLSAITGAISSGALPLDRMKLAGRTEGTLSATWRGSLANAVTGMTLTVTPPPSTAPNELPATADLRGTYNGGTERLEIASFSLATPATHVTASGTLGTKTANLHLTASTSNLGEFKPIFAAEGDAAQLPIELHGQASFNGTVNGRISSPAIAGRIQVENFESVIVPATAQLTGMSAPVSQPVGINVSQSSGAQNAGPARRMHWDSLTANLQYSPDALAFHNAVLRRGNAQVNFEFSAGLHGGAFTSNTPFSAQLDIRSAQLSDLQQLAGYNYPVDGTVNLRAQLSGTELEPRGNGRVVITNATAYDQPIARATSDVVFANHEAQFTNLELAQNQARVKGTAAYNLTTRGFRFNLRGSDFNLANLKALNRGNLKSSGAMNFTAEVSGTAEEPAINADVAITRVVVNSEKIGDINARARTTGDTMSVIARSNVADSDLVIDGSVRLRENYPTALAIRFNHLDLDPVLTAYIKGRVTGHSSFAGAIDLRGPLRQWRDLQITGDLSQLYIPVENIEIHNQGPIRFAMTQQVFNLQQFHVSAEDTDLSATGTAEVAGEHRLSLAANGHVNLKLIHSLNSDYTSSGQLAMDVRVRGTVTEPRLNGQLQVSNGAISYIDLPNGLSDINGSLAFNSDRLQIRTLTGRTGGGQLNMTGYVTYGRTIGFNIQAVANDIRLRYPPGVSSMADANVRLTGTLQSSLLSGDVTVTRFGLNPRFDFAQYLARSKQVPEIPNPNSTLSNLKLDIHVTSTPELQVQTSLAKLSGNVDMRLRGTALHPALLGRAVIVEGDVFFNGTKYHLERGDVTFTNPTRIEPVLDIEASTRVRDYDITLGFHGPTDKLSTTYRSDPPLATADIIALLAFGRTREESALQPVSNQNFTETASNAILGQALNATVSSRVQKLFGVSRIKIDPQVGGAENNPGGARVTIEQQVSNDLTVTYVTDVARSNQQIISVEYNVTRAVSVVAVRDQYGVVSFDVRVRQRKR